MAYYDPANSLLYIHSSRRNASFAKIAEAITERSEKIDGEAVFRVLGGLQRLILHNVGLTSRTKNVRYRMYAGLDVRDAIDPPEQLNAVKANITGVGYEEGLRKSVGCSYKGKVWSISSSTVPEWCDWCDEIGSKLLNDTSSPDDFLQHTLVPKEVAVLPASPALMVDWPDQLFMSTNFNFRVFAESKEHDFHSCELELLEAAEGGSTIKFRLHAGNSKATYLMKLIETKAKRVVKIEYKVQQLEGPKLQIAALRTTCPSDEFFTENPPLVRFADGSQLSGNILLSPKHELPSTFDDESIVAVDWLGTALKKESRWKSGVYRKDSIQEFFLGQLKKNGHYAFLIDDDDQGESADIVAIIDSDQEILVRLIHCKYSGGPRAGSRAGDLYEVCGQAQKSVKWTWSFRHLVDHLKNRETIQLGGRDTRFYQGTLKDLMTLRRSSRRKRVKYNIWIVQPGISKASIPNEHKAILGATDRFVRCVTNYPLRIFGSA